jgi:hypothetical protein
MVKNLSFLVLVILCLGCEIYQEPTYPNLSGQWLLKSIELTNSGSTMEGSYHILDDTVVVQQYTPVSINGDVITFSRNYNDPTLKWYDKFIINHTVWEFETNIVGIPTTIGGKRGYSESSYYYPSKDLISGQWNSILIAEGNRHIGIDEYGMEVIELTLPRVWTMFRRNTNVEFFFQETITLRFRRI